MPGRNSWLRMRMDFFWYDIIHPSQNIEESREAKSFLFISIPPDCTYISNKVLNYE